MPLEELLAIYRYEPSVSTAAGSSMDSSSGELADDLPDMTLDKVTCVLLAVLPDSLIFYMIWLDNSDRKYNLSW